VGGCSTSIAYAVNDETVVKNLYIAQSSKPVDLACLWNDLYCVDWDVKLYYTIHVDLATVRPPLKAYQQSVFTSQIPFLLPIQHC